MGRSEATKGRLPEGQSLDVLRPEVFCAAPAAALAMAEGRSRPWAGNKKPHQVNDGVSFGKQSKTTAKLVISFNF